MAFNELSGSGHVCHYNTKNLSIYSRHFWPFDCPLALILLWPASSVNISPIVSLGTNGTMWTRKGQLKWTQKEAENQKMCFKWRCAPKQEEQKVGHRVSPRRFFFLNKKKRWWGVNDDAGGPGPGVKLVGWANGPDSSFCIFSLYFIFLGGGIKRNSQVSFLFLQRRILFFFFGEASTDKIE